MSAVTTRERDVRMPGAQIGFESDGQCCVLHPFVELKKMWMTFPNADPDDFRRTFRWKRPNAFNGQEKCAELDRAQVFAQCTIDMFRYVGKESESEIHLMTLRPAHTANARVKIDEGLLDNWRRGDRNKEALGFHFWPRTSAPERASSPLLLTRGGIDRFTIFMTRAIRFGNNAFAAMMKYADQGMTRLGLP